MSEKLESLLVSLRMEVKSLEERRSEVAEVFSERSKAVQSVSDSIADLEVEKGGLKGKLFKTRQSPASLYSYLRLVEERLSEAQGLYEVKQKEARLAERHLELAEEEVTNQLIELKRIEQLIQEQESEKQITKKLRETAEEQDSLRKNKK